MGKRRGNGEGSIYKRADGYWVGQVDTGEWKISGNGKPVRERKRVVRRYRDDVVIALDDLRRSIAVGIVPDRTRTFGDFLDWWLDNVKAPHVKPDTLRQQRSTAKAVKAVIGPVKLVAVRKGHVEKVLASAGHLSTAAQSARLSLVKDALGWAVGDDLLTRNPAATVRKPMVRAKIDDIPTLAEHQAIMAAAEGDPLYALAWLATTYGLREGELMNLTWDDVDLPGKVLYVQEAADGTWSPKSETSKRKLPLIPEAIEVLEAHARRQVRDRMASLDWFDSGHVFTGARRGRPGYKLTADQVRDWWKALCVKADVKPKPRTIKGRRVMGMPRFHTARKLAGIQLRRLGVPLDIAMRILGHANIAMTAEVYAIPDEEMLYEAMVKAFAKAS